MQVTYYGFTLESENKCVPLAVLFDSLAAKSGGEVGAPGTMRMMYVDDQSDAEFVCGLIVTSKDQKSFLKMSSVAGKYKIKSTDLTGDDRIMEFNFFVVNKSNGIGLYQYYRGSCSAVTMGSFLTSEFRELSDSSKELQLNAAETVVEVKRGQKSKLIRGIRSAHRGGLIFNLLVRAGDVPEILNRYKTIVAFDYDIASLDSLSSFARPLKGLVTKVHQRVRFNELSTKDQIIEGVSGMLPQILKDTARVTVLNDDDEPMSVRLVNMPDNFGLHDYDVLAAELDGLDLEDFASHAVVGYLKLICKSEYPEVFMADLS
ncbi:hypothetical protein ABDX87_09605 [Pseudomonas abietaniphila]|uniref:hypothetical protein n=1 Tax=Pseudomonas abietaniphila TaxID=89065 RepID=UPI0032179EEE